MISITTATALTPTALPLPAWRTPLAGKAAAREASPGPGLPSLSDLRDSQQSMRKEMAARKVQAVRERRDALMLLVRLDPKAALKMTAAMAKELKSAVAEYVEAGGRNVTDGEMAMLRRDAEQAREAADGALEAVPEEPGTSQGDAPAGSAPAVVDVALKRAQAAYAAAYSVADTRDERADRAEFVLGTAMADRGFFDQVKQALAELKEAREKIKADWAHPRAPGKDDWKDADSTMADLERSIDMAPSGPPEAPPTGTSVQV